MGMVLLYQPHSLPIAILAGVMGHGWLVHWPLSIWQRDDFRCFVRRRLACPNPWFKFYSPMHIDNLATKYSCNPFMYNNNRSTQEVRPSTWGPKLGYIICLHCCELHRRDSCITPSYMFSTALYAHPQIQSSWILSINFLNVGKFDHLFVHPL